MTTYYHVTYGDWDGADLLCYGSRTEAGEDVEWKWDEPAPGYDSHLVSLFDDLDDAIKFHYWYCRDPYCAGEILRVELPEDDDERARLGVVVVRDSEGYPAIPARIPAEIITRVRA